MARAQAVLNLPASRRTVARAIQELGFRSLARRAKGVLTAPVRALRRAFAAAMLGFTVMWWVAHVHMSLDVVTFPFSRYPIQWGNSQRKRVYRRPGEGLAADCTCQTKKHTTGNPGVKVLGGLSWGSHECTLAHPFTGRWNSQNFIQMLPLVVAALWEAYPAGPPGGGPWLVLFDNDSVFKSQATLAALQAQNIQPATFAGGRGWPSQFQDCHIIENFFAECKKRLERSAPEGLETRVQFTARVVQVMLSVDAAYIRSLVESMPRRMAAVVQAGGAVTKY
jgi:hypothetical protein